MFFKEERDLSREKYIWVHNTCKHTYKLHIESVWRYWRYTATAIKTCFRCTVLLLLRSNSILRHCRIFCPCPRNRCAFASFTQIGRSRVVIGCALMGSFFASLFRYVSDTWGEIFWNSRDKIVWKFAARRYPGSSVKDIYPSHLTNLPVYSCA